jgi:hypothetical protein
MFKTEGCRVLLSQTASAHEQLYLGLQFQSSREGLKDREVSFHFISSNQPRNLRASIWLQAVCWMRWHSDKIILTTTKVDTRCITPSQCLRWKFTSPSAGKCPKSVIQKRNNSRGHLTEVNDSPPSRTIATLLTGLPPYWVGNSRSGGPLALIWSWSWRICSSSCQAPRGKTSARTGSRAASCRSTCTVFSAPHAARQWHVRPSIPLGKKRDTLFVQSFSLAGNRSGGAKEHIAVYLCIAWNVNDLVNGLQGFGIY